MEGTRERIERILRERLRPIRLELRDESARHAGHPGSSTGGGHYEALIVSELFEGLELLEQHRLVNEALRDLLGREIHSLALRTVRPSEWRGTTVPP